MSEKISLTSPIVINVPTRASLAVKTKGLLFLWLANLNNKSNVFKNGKVLKAFSKNQGNSLLVAFNFSALSC